MPKTKALFFKDRGCSRYSIVALLSIFLSVSACGEMSNRESTASGSIASEGEFSTALPKLLQKHRRGLTAEVEAIHKETGQVRTAQLNIDDAHQVSGTLTGLAVGNYTFTIRYRINGVLVAEKISNGLVKENEATPVAFATLTFPDKDGDGFTNFAEVQIGTDPDDPGSKPGPQIIRASTSYLMTDLTGISPVEGPAVVGQSKSTSYIMDTGL